MSLVKCFFNILWIKYVCNLYSIFFFHTKHGKTNPTQNKGYPIFKRLTSLSLRAMIKQNVDEGNARWSTASERESTGWKTLVGKSAAVTALGVRGSLCEPCRVQSCPLQRLMRGRIFRQVGWNHGACALHPCFCRGEALFRRLQRKPKGRISAWISH